MRLLTLCLLALFVFSRAARADDKTVCIDAYNHIQFGSDKVAACTSFLATHTGTSHEIALALDLLGFAHFKAGRYEMALAQYKIGIATDPSFVPPYVMSALINRKLGFFDSSLAIANAAILLEPKNYLPLAQRGLAQAGKGNFDAAIDDFDNAAKLDAASDKLLDVQTARGQAFSAKKDFAPAIDKFDSVLKTDPNHREAAVGRCDVLRATNASNDKLDACSAAISEIDAVPCNDYNTTTADNRAAACNRIFAATAPTAHALAIAHMWKGVEFKNKRQNDAALTEFDLAVQAAPDFWNAYSVRGNAKQELKSDIDGALADFDQAIKLNPSNYNVYKDRGNARLFKGDYDGAIADFDIAMPHFANPLYTMIERGRAKLYKKDFDGAIADLSAPIEKPLASQSDLYRAYLVRCMAYNGKGNGDAAISDCNKAIRINPNTGGAYGERGIAYVAQGKLTDALSDFNTALKFNPNYIKSYASRGGLYERNKDFENARADYQFVATKSTPFDSAVIVELRQSARQRLAALPPPAPLPQKHGALPSPARVALVIGNGAYKHVPALPNPPKDANAVAKALEGVGFSVVKLSDDMSRDGFLQALRAFSRDAAKADWAVVYYAGHGIEIGGVNYLIPVDAKLLQDTDAAEEAVSLELVIASVSGAKKLRLVMLDACRDNPFAKTMQRSIGVQLVNKGLSNIEPDAGIMIVYATKHGETAMDGASGHSPFATAVISDIPKPGIEVRRLFDIVRDDVMKATDRAQQPFSYGSLPGSQEFFFVAGK